MDDDDLFPESAILYFGSEPYNEFKIVCSFFIYDLKNNLIAGKAYFNINNNEVHYSLKKGLEFINKSTYIKKLTIFNDSFLVVNKLMKINKFNENLLKNIDVKFKLIETEYNMSVYSLCNKCVIAQKNINLY